MADFHFWGKSRWGERTDRSFLSDLGVGRGGRVLTVIGGDAEDKGEEECE